MLQSSAALQQRAKSKLQSLSNERNLSPACNLINSNLSLLQSAPVQSPAKTFPSKSCFNAISAAELHSNKTNRAAQAHAACPLCCGMFSCMVMGHSKFLTGGSRNQWVAIIPTALLLLLLLLLWEPRRNDFRIKWRGLGILGWLSLPPRAKANPSHHLRGFA